MDTQLDFQDWLSELSTTRRRIIEAMASGKSTAATASELGIAVQSVQRLRKKCHEDWQAQYAEG